MAKLRVNDRIMNVFKNLWMIAAVIGLGIGIFNWVRSGTFDHLVYFPLACSLFCVLLYFNVRGHLRFLDRMRPEQFEDPDDKK